VLDVTEQLRRYGEAVERWLPEASRASDSAPPAIRPPTDDDGTHAVSALPGGARRRGRPVRWGWGGRPGPGRIVLAAAAAAVVVTLGVGAIVLWPSNTDQSDLRTRGSAGPPSSTATSPTASLSTTTESQPTTTPPTTSPTPVEPAPRPGPDDTGPTDTAVLVPKTGDEIEAMMQPGAVIENVDITGGNIDVVADDVTIRNFRLDAAGAPFGFRSCGPDTDCGADGDQRTGFVAEDGEIFNTSNAAFRGRHATLRRLEVHESDASGFIPLSDVTIERSWWHHLGRGEGASANGVQFQGGGTNLVVRSNFCDLPVTVPPPYNSSACVIAGTNTDPTLSASIEHNWFNGGNHTVQCSGQNGIAVHDNRFGRDYRNGPLVRCPNSSQNVWDDTGEPI
jgi:hypothetical protein